MSLTLIPASRLSEERLALLWSEAFIDYYVPMQLSAPRYAALVRRELISLDDSFVALVDDLPVGFALGALRRQGDRLLGYDAGTAVIPAYRRQGIARQLMEALLWRFRTLAVERVTLTAVSSNAQAIALYRSLGFSELRQLSCWEKDGSDQSLSRTVPGLRAVKVAAKVIEPLAVACYRQPPEWQNNPSGEKLATAEAWLAVRQGRPVGYALIGGAKSPTYLYQLGVLPACRGQGVAGSLLASIRQERAGGNLIYLNHPAEEQEGTAWLEKMRCTIFLRQVEMGLSLLPSERCGLAVEPIQITEEE